jgi:hypothetical protein
VRFLNSSNPHYIHTSTQLGGLSSSVGDASYSNPLGVFNSFTAASASAATEVQAAFASLSSRRAEML